MSPKIEARAHEQTPSSEEVRVQLRTMLASPAFQGSRRSQQFLDYVVEKTLAGDEASVKERLIAVNVFGRDPRIDVPDDTIVRVSAREVRKRLAQYYNTEQGAAALIRIDLPAGTYVPEFRTAAARVGPSRVQTEVLERLPGSAGEIPATTLTTQRGWFLVGGIGVGAVAVAAIWFALVSRDPGPFEVFWGPVLHSSESTLLAVANPMVYHPSARAQRLNDELHPTEEGPGQRPLNLLPKQLDGSDFVPVYNQYVGVGDMVAATEATAMLARHNKLSRIRLSSSIEFSDLRGTNAVLIGAVTNRWTIEMQKNWRFQFRRQAGVRNVIVDTVDSKEWSLPIRQDGSAQEDYVLLCRIPNSFTGGLLLVAAGMRQFGTEAGGRLLTDRVQLNPVLSKLPGGWESKNLQVVLRVRVIGNAPAQPELVAWNLW